ncbi:uncharacterized protein LOC134257793 [Saccostrea cucullata]|uniref:uncharacterized protein LOC134257793 n=1 Tax=Saccostrea cuccullata TaxID=36930 RepID=UPI002ED6024C
MKETRKRRRRKNAEVERSEVSESETEKLDVSKRRRRRRKNAEVERSEVSESEPEELDVSKKKCRRRQNAEVKRAEVSESEPEVSVPEPNILVTDFNEHDGRLIKEVHGTIVESAWGKLESFTTFDDIQIKVTEFATEFPPILKLPKGIPSFTVRLDDIHVTGKTRHEHLQNLEQVLQKLEKAGVRLKKEKCVFMADEVTYLGHRINKFGRQPTEDKVQAIKNLPEPSNIKELQAFLGMLNYYDCYLPKLSIVLQPLHELLSKDVSWSWGSRQSKAIHYAYYLQPICGDYSAP